MSSVTTDREGRSAKAAGRTDVPCADWLGRCRPGSRVLRSPLPHPFPSRSGGRAVPAPTGSSVGAAALRRGEVNTRDKEPRLARSSCRREPPGASAGIRQSRFAAHQFSALCPGLGFSALPLSSLPSTTGSCRRTDLLALPADGRPSPLARRRRGATRRLEKRNVLSLFLASIPASRSQRLRR